MNEPEPEWLDSGRGIPPVCRWSFGVDAPLVEVRLASESGEVLAADQSGGLYLFDRKGKVIAVSRGFGRLKGVDWSDAGDGGAAAISDRTLAFINRELKPVWTRDLPDDILAVAVDPFANYLAVGLANGTNVVFDRTKKFACRFDTIRPLSFIRFLASEPIIVGAADYGHLCCHEADGGEIWNEKLWSAIGDLAVSGDGDLIYIAGFSHGVQAFDGRTGKQSATLMMEGTPQHVSTSFARKRLVASTIEHTAYWMDGQGEPIWAAELPDEISRVRCDPLGRGFVCGLSNGRLHCLEWELPEDE